MKVRPNLLAMKLVYCFFCLLFFSSWGVAQDLRSESDNIGRQLRLVYTRYESDSTLTLKQKDSLYAVLLELDKKILKLREIEDSIIQIAAKLNIEAARLYSLLENNEISSAPQRDSLVKVLAHTQSRAEAIVSKLRFIPDKRDSLDRTFAEIDAHQPALDQAIKDLIDLVSAPDAYYFVQIEGIKKLARSRHPAALAFLMDNLMSFASNGDPTMYGASPSFYVWPDNYPCYQWLMWYNKGWHLLPHFKKALEKRRIPENHINLYGEVLAEITEGCRPCWEAILAKYLEETASFEEQKIFRSNVLKMMEYYKNPKK